jgi:hypothetical protein
MEIASRPFRGQEDLDRLQQFVISQIAWIPVSIDGTGGKAFLVWGRGWWTVSTCNLLKKKRRVYVQPSVKALWEGQRNGLLCVFTRTLPTGPMHGSAGGLTPCH